MNRNKWLQILCIAIVLVLVWFFILFLFRPTPKVNESRQLYDQIDSLNRVIDKAWLKIDSLQCRIDTSNQAIVVIHKDYEEKYIDLSNAPIGEQLSFFSDYLSESN